MLIVLETLAGTSARAAGPYFTRTTQVTPHHTHEEQYFDTYAETVQGCATAVAVYGYSGSTVCHPGTAFGMSLTEAGWLCIYGPNACKVAPADFFLYDGYACPVGKRYVPAINKCIPWIDRNHDKPGTCSPHFGNPLYPLTGNKVLTADLGNWSVGTRRIAVGYDTRLKVPTNNATLALHETPAPSFGELWASSLHKKLAFQLNESGTKQAVQASRGAGVWISFLRDDSGNYLPDADLSDRIVPVPGGWRYTDAAARSEETYDSLGKLQSVSYASGASLTYTYSTSSTPVTVAPAAGLLIAVQGHDGRSVQFQYEQPGGAPVPRVKGITDPAGQATGVVYDGAGNLDRFSWPDGTSRQYLYERSDIPWALTGILDENASRLSTYGYDAEGRANETQRAGGADHYSASYTLAPRWNVVETFDSVAQVIWRDHYWQSPQGTSIAMPNGSTSSIAAALVLGIPRPTSQTQPAGSGCAASTSSQTYDANGNVASKDDFNGNRVCYGSDLSRNLEAKRVEGLASTAVCSSVTVDGAALPAGSRKVSTQWHPDWQLEAKRAKPGRITTHVYNGQPDPFNTGALASCAPSTAMLPDGKPIAVLCKRVEQATTDGDGHLGFSAALQSGVANRTNSWTYDPFGRVLTELDPLGNPTSYRYYADTTADHTVGDLQSMTNALGAVTNYTKYNKYGQLLESIDANGVLTANTYDLRQRRLSTSVGGQATGYTYDPAGQLTRIIRPDASYLGYEYDAAHRLKAVFDNKANRIEYTLDDAGNRTAEKVKDPTGALTRQLTRSIDALGRVQRVTGRAQPP